MFVILFCRFDHVYFGITHEPKLCQQVAWTRFVVLPAVNQNSPRIVWVSVFFPFWNSSYYILNLLDLYCQKA